MRVALYQCPPLPLDVAGNLKRLHQLAHEATGADVLVLPEMFLTGYNIGAEAVGALAEAQDGESAQSDCRHRAKAPGWPFCMATRSGPTMGRSTTPCS